MARITFVTGRAGSGKSRFLHGRIKELTASGQEVVLIVPEQFTFETERELSTELPGLMDAAVFSFTTLARRVLSESGERTVFLSRQGRRMMIRREADALKNELTAFAPVAERPGFCEKCDELFSLFKRFDITPEALTHAAEAASEDALGGKLADLALIYGAVTADCAGRVMDSDDALNALRERLPSSSLCGKYIFIDGFDMLTEQIYQVIGGLMRVAAGMYVSIRFDPDARDRAVFLAEEKARARLTDMAREAGLTVACVTTPDSSLPPARYVSKELAHLEREAFSYPFRVYEGECKNITLFASTDRVSEVRAMTTALIKAAHSGIRYREMAVVATDMAGYLSPVTREFRSRGVPFFTDAKHSLSIYAAPRLALFAVSAVAHGFPRDDIVSVMKTGLSGVSPDDADIFENYILMSGAYGTRLTRPLAGKNVPEAAERARTAVMEPLLKLRQSLSAASDAAGKTEALYAYLEELGVYAKLAELTEELKAAGRRQLMEENAQVYDRLMELFGQIHKIMGGSRMSVARFLAVLREGMNAYEVGAIPTTADQVLFGSVGRTRARSIRALFLLGASEGLFPRSCADEGVIDDAELARFPSLDLIPWDTTSDKNGVELVNAYSALSKPSEQLYISYPLQSGSEPALPAAVTDRIREIFPTLCVGTDMNALPEAVDASGGVYALGRRLVRFTETMSLPEGTAELYSSVARSASKDRLALMENALYESVSPEPFGRELAQELYGSAISGSATRLEKFNGCPFSHFVQYGLKAMPRKEFRERKTDEGQFLHAVLAECIKRALDAGSFDPDRAEMLVDEVASGVIESHNGGIFLDTARGRVRSAELVRTVKRTLRAVLAQLSRGEFTPSGAEVAFGEGRPLPPITVETGRARYFVSGVIDRMDEAVIDGEQYYRVIDYKTSGRRLDYAELLNGLSLQLPLYVAALMAADSAKRAAGLYYMPINVPAVEAENDEAFKKALRAQFRLSGLTLSDERVISAYGPAGETLPGGGGATADAMMLNAAASYAVRRSRDTLDAIMEGRAEVSPYYKRADRHTPCEWCEYPSVCGFDPKRAGCAYRVIGRLSAEEFFDKAGAQRDENEEARDGLD